MTDAHPDPREPIDDSGFRFGPFEIHDEVRFHGRRPLKIQQRGGCVYYPYPADRRRAKINHGPSAVDRSRPIIIKGNYFPSFTHIRDFDPTRTWFWDNCLIPQLMQPNQANPRGDKIWCRLVKGSTAPREITATASELEDHLRRVNSWASREAGRPTDVRSWIRAQRPVEPRGRRLLWAQSLTQTISNYYGRDLAELRQKLLEICAHRGWELVERPKQNRRSRQQFTLTDQLLSEDYRGCVITHSAAAVEVLATGTPVVSLGADAAHDLQTSWNQFLDDEFTLATPEQVDSQILRLLAVTWHKQELLSGTWAETPSTHLPYTTWRLYD